MGIGDIIVTGFEAVLFVAGLGLVLLGTALIDHSRNKIVHRKDIKKG